jgi:hypothetical protein
LLNEMFFLFKFFTEKQINLKLGTFSVVRETEPC